MGLAETLSEYVRACFSGIWITSHEHGDALREIAALCRAEAWAFATWDIATGWQQPGTADHSAEVTSAPDPVAAVRAIHALATPDGAALVVLQNFHRFLNSPEVIQEVARQRLRTWAGGRCLSADQPGIYQYRATQSERARRQIARGASNN